MTLFTRNSALYMPLEDEMPAAPPMAGEEGGETQATSVDLYDQVDASLFETVHKMGDALPAGTFPFRLRSYSQLNPKNATTGVEEPYFRLLWSCQKEPNVGRIFADNVPWVDKATIDAAKDPQNPMRAAARALINERLARAKAIMEAAQFKPTGQFGFKEFLNNNPEMFIEISNYQGRDGNHYNKAKKYISLARPL